MGVRNGKLISITLKEEVIEVLDQIAKEDQRDRSSVIKKAIMEYIKRWRDEL